MLTALLLTGIIVALVWMFPIGLNARRHLHILQLEEYANGRLARWAKSEQAGAGRTWRWLGLGVALVIVVAAAATLAPLAILLLVAWLFPAQRLAAALRPQPAKKPLVYTARVRRLILATVLVTAGGATVIALPIYLALHGRNAIAAIALMFTLPIVLLLVLDHRLVVAGNLVARPLEAGLRAYYVADARRRVRRLNPAIIGITGSFGKTTTKELLASMLSSRFRVMKTPESWNTEMGVTRAIRERLTDQHEFFVVEMGAYQRGEIAALCRLTGPPRIGILTGINEQHLERFGGIENTIRAKYELIEAIQPNGLAIFNVDNAHCRRLADRTTRVRVIRIGLDPNNGPFDYTAKEIGVSAEGTRFLLIASNQTAQVRARLLGEHFILNILAAAAAAVESGMTVQQIAAAVAAMPPVPHRLQLLPSAEGITTIDDAYSANPDGARAALRVLGQMDGGQRILVTPGFVELGDREAEFNRGLGELAVGSCDILVLVGPRRTAPIREGALSAGMDASNIEVVGSIEAARVFLRSIARRGDIVLFENDLPDNYNE